MRYDEILADKGAYMKTCWGLGYPYQKMEQLVRDARWIILSCGESDHVPVQFSQQAWLREANKLVPFRDNDPVPELVTHR